MIIDRSRPLIGVVTVLYQSDDVLDDFFASLDVQQDVNLKLYVIDNSATDSGSVLARKLADQVGIETRVIFNNANLGVARGNNQGIELALADGCEYVLLANNDVEFRGVRTIAELVDRNGKGDVLATCPKIFYHGTNRIWCAGGFISRMKAVVKHVGDGVEDRGQFNQEFVTEYAPTCFTLLHKSVFSRVGVMDEQYFVYYDDVDFVWRMNKAGIRLLYVPSSEVAHKVSFSTGGGESPFTLFYVTRNRIYFSRKSLGTFSSAVPIAYSLLAMLYKYPRFTVAGRKSVLRGIASGLRLGLSVSCTAPAGYMKGSPQKEGI
ncbi:glycosyltransferase family 2 protein [Paraburkholderia sp. Tr-20389]|uniref:glycosyltransferase family 2 protein n=1 Tax=Paraburkholderia sp. Tr-20389 TaxID=2703903 RepID=UPI001982710A|nr:glycosyltransferase family 2 protein [Paraburkholderia sp. Tr-20389]MBN3753587.1 glycosyltransferase family 2 protein [Paraburkholderia sp. Tr-20389]